MAIIKRDPKKVALAQAILDAYQPKSAEEMNDALKDLFGPMFEAMLKGELNHHLGYESNDKSQKKMIIDVTVIVRSRSRRLRAISRSMSPETVTVLLNLNSFQNEKKMFLQSKIRFWLCMRAACRKEISPRRSRISMASACHMR